MIYIIPTPIGNLEDITIRAKNLLDKSEVIFCEDTRMTLKLLRLLDIYKDQKLISMLYNQNFNFKNISKSLDEYTSDKTFSIVSDAGMPGISDPGYEIIQLLIERELDYTVLPGANAALCALVASGFPSHEFLFTGFLPLKKGRQTKLKQLAALNNQTIILYESSHRIEKVIQELQQFFNPDNRVCLINDISKLYEKIWRGKISDLTEFKTNAKGEWVIVLNNN